MNIKQIISKNSQHTKIEDRRFILRMKKRKSFYDSYSMSHSLWFIDESNSGNNEKCSAQKTWNMIKCADRQNQIQRKLILTLRPKKREEYKFRSMREKNEQKNMHEKRKCTGREMCMKNV